MFQTTLIVIVILSCICFILIWNWKKFWKIANRGGTMKYDMGIHLPKTTLNFIISFVSLSPSFLVLNMAGRGRVTRRIARRTQVLPYHFYKKIINNTLIMLINEIFLLRIKIKISCWYLRICWEIAQTTCLSFSLK